MAKPHATRTFAPLQFEALEPHRFEDLVRDLIYDYRDWASIEATGRSGSDEGYDIRAYERSTGPAPPDEDDESDSTGGDAPPHEGNRWMIQCKREKQLGPTRVTQIIEDGVKADDPPYGYILAAPTNFSKQSYDAFRASLVERGVQEFRLFGRAEMEDMLYMPKNDRILFAFFGISLSTKRRTRVSNIRFTVSNKNRLYSIFGASQHNHDLNSHVLVRDLNDDAYPDETAYPDFELRPGWREYIATHLQPDGLRVSSREYFAYVDLDKKEYDFTDSINLVMREVQSGDEEAQEKRRLLREQAEDFWRHLPRYNQATFYVDGLIFYDQIAYIDKQGDSLYQFPHLFVDFEKQGPFQQTFAYLKHGYENYVAANDLKRVTKFPKTFSKRQIGKLYEDRSAALKPYIGSRLRNNTVETIFDFSGDLKFLRPNDIVRVSGVDEKDGKIFIEITHRFEAKRAELEKQQLLWSAEQEAGTTLPTNQIVSVLEVKRLYEWELERLKAANAPAAK